MKQNHLNKRTVAAILLSKRNPVITPKEAPVYVEPPKKKGLLERFQNLFV